MLIARCLPALLGLGLAACSSAPPPVKPPRPVVVEAPQPLTGPGAVEAFPGTILARNEADLSFRVAGKIASRAVELGTRVKPGMVLAVLDPEDARLNLDAARASEAASEADLWLAQAEEKRYQELKARGHVGQSMLDSRINTTRLAQARLDQARSQLNLARNQSAYTQLKSDVNGVITEVMGEPGNVVSAGQAVLRVAPDGEREVRIFIPEGRVEALRSAPQLTIRTLARQDRPYAAKVRDISPAASRSTRTHEARVTILEPDDAVSLGATAGVLLAQAGDARTFRLPAAALTGTDKNAPVVWALARAKEGATTVAPRPVRVLQYLHDAVIVTGDLKPEDRLVTAGVHLLTPGMAVEPIERSAKATL